MRWNPSIRSSKIEDFREARNGQMVFKVIGASTNGKKLTWVTIISWFVLEKVQMVLSIMVYFCHNLMKEMIGQVQTKSVTMSI